ncbi:MAG: hypothetical protein JXB25_10405 [Deltaproteobacteria bacterium]|nr:hypothetical protein [Deltaproteobacteria bacterium]
MPPDDLSRPSVAIGGGVETETFLGVSYHPFRYFSARPATELNPLMESFLQLMETPDETKTNRELFRLAAADIELRGGELWDVVLREALLYSRFMVRSRSRQGELLLRPPATFFHLHPHLVGSFRRSGSVAESSCEKLQDTFPPVYLHFGKEAGVVTADGRKSIDGAYARCRWHSEQKSLLAEILLAPGGEEPGTFLQVCSTLRRMAQDGGYIYFWLGYEDRPRTVREALDLNMMLNAEGVPGQVLLHNPVQLQQALGACRVLIPFFTTMTKALTAAREQGLGRQEGCDAVTAEGLHMTRRVIRGVEVLLVEPG